MNIQFDKTKIQSTLKETSYDDTGKEFLLEDTRRVCNFDEVSKQIGAQIRLGNKARSCDALYVGTKYIYLIEFKNRKSSDLKSEKAELHAKAYDSIFQLQIYLGEKEYLDDLVKKTRLILVYNDAKMSNVPKTDIASSKSVDKIIGKIKTFAKITDLDVFPKKFKLGELEGKLYDKVVTLDVSDFNDEVKNMIFS